MGTARGLGLHKTHLVCAGEEQDLRGGVGHMQHHSTHSSPAQKCGVGWVWLLVASRDDVLGTALQGYPGLPRQGEFLPWLLHLRAEKIMVKIYKGTPSSILGAPAPAPSLYQSLIAGGNAHYHWQVKCVCKDRTTALDVSLQAGSSKRSDLW